MSTAAEQDEDQQFDVSVEGGEPPDDPAQQTRVPAAALSDAAPAADAATLAARAAKGDLVVLRGILLWDPEAGNRLYTSATLDRWLEIATDDIVGHAPGSELNGMVSVVWVPSEAILVEGRRNRGKACHFAEAASDADLDPTSGAGARFPRYKTAELG